MRRRLDHGDIFRRVVVNSLRQFCTMYKINDEPVIAIDGRLMVTVHSGDIYELNVHEVNVESIGSSVRKKRKTRNTTAVAVSSKVSHDENSQAASCFDKVSQAADNIVDAGFGNDHHVCNLDLIPVTDVETLANVNVYTSEVQMPVLDSSNGASCSVNTEEQSAPAFQPTADCFAVEDLKPDVDLLLNCEVETAVTTGTKASGLSELSKTSGKRSGGHIAEAKIIKLHNNYTARRVKLASLRGASRATAKEERSSDRHYSRRRLQRTVGSTGTVFSCIECPDASYTSFELYHKHYLLHHGPISCHVCQLRILGHQNLRDHVQEEHPGETAYKNEESQNEAGEEYYHIVVGPPSIKTERAEGIEDENEDTDVQQSSDFVGTDDGVSLADGSALHALAVESIQDMAEQQVMLVQVGTEFTMPDGTCIQFVNEDGTAIDANVEALAVVDENSVASGVVNLNTNVETDYAEKPTASDEQSSVPSDDMQNAAKESMKKLGKPKFTVKSGFLNRKKLSTRVLNAHIEKSLELAGLYTSHKYECSLKTRRMRAIHRMTVPAQSTKQVYQCNLCRKVVRSIWGLKRHLRVDHQDKVLQSAAEGESSQPMKIPIRTLRDGNYLCCRDCDSKFETNQLFSKHRDLYHRKKTCGHCMNAFVGKIALQEHMKMVHPHVPIYKAANRFVCEFCNFVGGSNWMLQDHIETVHYGVKHTCDECGKSLGSALTLAIHKRQIHDPNYRHTCEACGMQFSRLAGLRDHLRSVHPHLMTEEQRQQVAQLVCAKCGASFARRQALRDHIQLKHSDTIKFYTCGLCGRNFTLRRYLVHHQRVKHQE